MSTDSSGIKIGPYPIGDGYPPFIIAEMSGNHNGSLDRALAIVDAAADAGAHALKLQTYTADTMTIDCNQGEFFIADENSLWHGETLYALYEKAHTPWAWHAPIMERCRERRILCFSSPFDTTAVDFLETLNVPAYKIASFELLDLPLIRYVARTGKPMIISTGLAVENEITDAVNAAREAGCRQLILLKCTSSYPADPAESNLRSIPYLKSKFGVEVGLSDHTLGNAAAIAAVTLGACVIEKHFTLDREDGGVDSAFSMNPSDLMQLMRDTEIARLALGECKLGPSPKERESLQFRRTLYVVEAMQAGDVFTVNNIRSIRPGLGLPPKYLEAILDKTATQAIPRGTGLNWTLISGGEPIA